MANGNESDFAMNVDISGYEELLTLLKEIDATLDSLNNQTRKILGTTESVASIVASAASVASVV